MTDYGIDDDLIKKLADTIPISSSALFLLLRKVQPGKGAGRIQGRTRHHPALLRSLAEQEEQLRKALASEPAVAAPAA